VGDDVTQTTFSRAHRREYRRKVQLSLDVFETMLHESSFEVGTSMTGMEIECNLVDAEYQPAMTNAEVLTAIADPAYQTELGAYNIEFNVPPRPLPGRTALAHRNVSEVPVNMTWVRVRRGRRIGCFTPLPSSSCDRGAAS
jgi:hypothetical protein